MNKLASFKYSKITSAIITLLIVFLLSLTQVAFAASGLSETDENGNPINKNQQLIAQGQSQGEANSTTDKDNNDLYPYDQQKDVNAATSAVEALNSKDSNAEGTSGDSPYVDNNVDSLFSPGGSTKTGGEKLTNGGVKILKMITTSFLLPLGVLFVLWRLVYLGFIIIANTDPVGILGANNTRNIIPIIGRKEGSAKRYQNLKGNSHTEKAQCAIKQELQYAVIGLIIVFAVWVILTYGIQVVLMILGLADSFVG